MLIDDKYQAIVGGGEEVVKGQNRSDTATIVARQH